MSQDALNGRQREIVAQAQQAFKSEDYAQAASLLETVYGEIQTVQLNHLLVEALYMHEEYARARSFADEFLDSYLTTDTDYRFLLTLLLRVHEFILAHEIVASIDDESLQEIGTDMISGAEAEASQSMKTTLTTVAKQFYHMTDYQPSEQQRRFQAALKLPLADFEKGAQFLLLDPYLHPLFMVSILEVLQRVGMATPVSFRWLDDATHKVVPKDLVPLTKLPSYQAVQTQLKQQLASEDPVAYTLISQELRLQLTLAYPFLDRVVTDPAAWVTRLIDVYRGTPSEVDRDTREWQKKLEQLTAELMANNDA